MATDKKTSKKNLPSKQARESRAKVAPAEYNAVVNEARLIKIALVNLDFKIDIPSFMDDSELRPFFGSKSDSTIHYKESGHAAQTYNWRVDIKSGRKKVFKIDATYAVIYSNMHTVNNESLNLFFGRTTRFVTYPYFRNLVSQISSMADVQLPPMPLINNLAVSQPRNTHSDTSSNTSSKKSPTKRNAGKKK